MTRLLAPLLGLALASGCATSLSSAHSPKVLPKAHFEATFGPGVMLPVGVLTTTVDAGRQVISEVSAQEGKVALEEVAASNAAVAVAALILSPPAPVTELTVRYGVAERLDVGVRYSGPALRGEVHGQLVDTPDWSLAAGLGIARHAFEGPLLSLLEKFKLAEFTRTDLDFSLLAGRECAWGALYAGAKFVYSSYS